MQTQFYTYLYTDPKTNVIRYVGKGCRYRARAHTHAHSNKRLTNIIQKRVREGYKVTPILLANNISESTSFALERFWINVYGREDLGTGTLFNLTNGGEGSSGRVCSEGMKQKISALHKGKPLSQEYKQKIREANRGKPGRPMSDEARAKRSETKRLWWAHVKREAQRKERELSCI